MRRLAVLILTPLVLSEGQHRSAPPLPMATACDHLPQVAATRAVANDNRTAAGSYRGDTLYLALVVDAAAWYPEADDGCALEVLAFREEGGTPSVPGPLIRVPSGTPMLVSVRNASGRPLWLRGFHDHPTEFREGIELSPGAAKPFQFTATTPGTYAYGATPVPPNSPSLVRGGEWSQLVGAFVVDSAGAANEPADRVLVISRWTVPNPGDPVAEPLFGLAAVNGKSWPHTELLSYTLGDTVNWRVINGSGAPHPMHLHGFYFQVTATGTFRGDTVLARPRMVVTEPMIAGQTMQMRWVAERTGNWLFHCHLLVHMTPEQQLHRMPDSASALLGVAPSRPPRARHGQATTIHHQRVHGAGHHAMHGMAGLIVGVVVHPRLEDGAQHGGVASPRRTLRLFANRRADPTQRIGSHAFVLQEGELEPAPDSVLIPSSPLILRRNEPVQINVHNRTRIPLSVHWHGLELESFFDGVGDWSGAAGSIAPPIAPGDSFVVHLTPPRAGTFMYHVHGEEGSELAQGLYGALVVQDDQVPFDPSTDRILLVSDAGEIREDGVLVNGSKAPRFTLTAGQPHRLRIIGITGSTAAEVAILEGAKPVLWRLLARDGAEITDAFEPVTPAVRLVAPGMIADYELTPERASDLLLRVTLRPRGATREMVAADVYEQRWTVPIRVVAPQ